MKKYTWLLGLLLPLAAYATWAPYVQDPITGRTLGIDPNRAAYMNIVAMPTVAVTGIPAPLATTAVNVISVPSPIPVQVAGTVAVTGVPAPLATVAVTGVPAPLATVAVTGVPAPLATIAVTGVSSIVGATGPTGSTGAQGATGPTGPTEPYPNPSPSPSGSMVVSNGSAYVLQSTWPLSSVTGWHYEWTAADLLSANSADWVVNSNAYVTADTVNNAIVERYFDDTVEHGAGFRFYAPAGSTTMKLGLTVRMQTAPGGTIVITPRISCRQITPGSAAGAWSSLYSMTQISFPTNAYWLANSQTVAYSSVGIVAGKETRCEITRCGHTNCSGDTASTGNMNLMGLIVDLY
jgi:hypothetical protein